jgi:hypothetical protein
MEKEAPHHFTHPTAVILERTRLFRRATFGDPA